MFEGIKEGWTLLGLLRRLLVRLASIDKSLASLADSSALSLKLAVLQSGGSVEELRAEGAPGAGDIVLDDDADQTDEDLAEFERIEQDMLRRGSVPDDGADLVALKRALLLLEKEKE